MRRKTLSKILDARGFTLVEVLASVVILSIVMMGVLNLLIFTNKNAVANNERLVAINLAKATVERLKIDSSEYFDPDNVPVGGIEGHREIEINDTKYQITVEAKKEGVESLGLIKVKVTVKLPESSVKSEVEGYIRHG